MAHLLELLAGDLAPHVGRGDRVELGGGENRVAGDLEPLDEYAYARSDAIGASRCGSHRRQNQLRLLGLALELGLEEALGGPLAAEDTASRRGRPLGVDAQGEQRDKRNHEGYEHPS